MPITSSRPGRRVVVQPHYAPETTEFGIVQNIVNDVATIRLDSGLTYVTDVNATYVNPAWGREDQAEREHLTIARSLLKDAKVE